MSSSQSTDDMHGSLFRPGHNCWRVAHADRLSLLINGARYFAALRSSLRQARRSVAILAWDVDSRTRMVEQADDGLPPTLGDFLNAIVSRNRDLTAHVLSWDFSMLLALDREMAPVYKLDWRTHRRLRFRMDGEHPLGACHHQKVVVVDEAVGFVGGIDLTLARWDTDRHRRHEPLRRKADGSDTRPYHDIQAVLDGEAAAALGDLFRERWQRATGGSLRPRPGDADPWPDGVAPDLRDVEVAIARTMPAHGGAAAVREIEQLYLDSIARAERLIFIENQYLSSRAVGAALTERLRQPDGPEIVIIEPLKTDGWLSQNTMDVLRAEQLARLRAADRHGRLGVFYPHAPGLDDAPINVHAKTMVIDDQFLRVGSSNLSNRSMGLDTECDIAVQAAPGSDNASAIAAFRQRLLATHLDVDQTTLAATEQRTGSSLAAVESLRGRPRSLQTLAARAFPDRPVELPEPRIADPEQPIDPARVIEHFVPERPAAAIRPQLWRWGALVLLLLAAGAAWRLTPLASWIDAESLAGWIGALRDSPAAPLLAIAMFAVGGLLMVPVTALITATALALGPGLGFACSLVGSLGSAALTYAIGVKLGRHLVRDLVGERLNAISRSLAQRGVLAVSIVRVLPVAPFTLINLVAGASHLSFRDFFLGTLIGMTPGMAAMVLLIDSTVRFVTDPGVGRMVWLAACLALAALVGYLLVRWIRARGATDEPRAVAGDRGR